MSYLYNYIIGALLVALFAVALSFIIASPVIMVIAIFSISVSIFFVTEQKRSVNYFQEHLKKKKQEQANLISLLATEINNMIEECERSLLNVNSTQADAVEMISNSFVEIERLFDEQNILMKRSIAKNTPEYAKAESLSKEIKEFINFSIRGIQFGDINSQNLQFCLDTLRFIRGNIESIGQEELDIIINDIRDHLENIKSRRDFSRNPVSSDNMASGEVEFF